MERQGKSFLIFNAFLLAKSEECKSGSLLWRWQRVFLDSMLWANNHSVWVFRSSFLWTYPPARLTPNRSLNKKCKEGRHVGELFNVTLPAERWIEKEFPPMHVTLCASLDGKRPLYFNLYNSTNVMSISRFVDESTLLDDLEIPKTCRLVSVYNRFYKCKIFILKYLTKSRHPRDYYSSFLTLILTPQRLSISIMDKSTSQR